MKKILTNGKIITENDVICGYDLVIENEKIAKIIPHIPVTDDNYLEDCNGAYILPGLIDMHSDMIENLIQPRSTALFDIEFGIVEAERILVMSGITTMFHSVSMYQEGKWDTKKIRQAKMVQQLMEKIKEHQQHGAMIHNRFHLRYEIDNVACYEQVKSMLKDHAVDLFSIMDHSPGQGQYRNLSVYRKHMPGEGKNLTDEEFAEHIRKENEKEKLTEKQIEELVLLAQSQNIAVASHDDESVEKIKLNQKRGVNISEFPITIETASEAVKYGQLTVLGAPNVLLGGSHSGNLSAEEAVRKGVASILVSDYYPQALIHSIFELWRKKVLSLPDAVRLCTINPAKATKMDGERGSLKVGKYADIIVVDYNGQDRPFIRKVYANGTKVMDCQRRTEHE